MSDINTNTTGEQLVPGKIISVLQDVLKHWLLILSVTLIAAMGAFVVTDCSYRPQYRTTTTFVASAGGTSTTTYSNLSAANTLASVFTEVLNSSLLKQQVLETVGIESFDGTIQASAIEETNLLTMTVTGSDPRTVFLVTEAIIEHHHIVSDEVLGENILEVLQYPRVPTGPINSPGTSGSMRRAAAVAAVGMCILLGTRSFLSDKVRRKTEADSKLSCRVLGELRHEKKYRTLKDLIHRKKTSVLITDPLTSFMYTEAVNKLSGRVDKRRHRGEHVIMVTSLLENEGKSTVAVNLALSMVKKGKKVLLIDCDLRKPACHLILNQSGKGISVAEVLNGQATLRDGVQCLRSGLYLLPGKRNLRTAGNMMNAPAMKALLEEAAKEFDFVIVDTPPMSIAPDAECIGEAADAALLVVRQNGALAGDIEDTISVLEKTQVHLLGCVLNCVMEVYPSVAEFVVGPTALSLLSESGLPTAPVNAPNYLNAVWKGALFGAVVWVGIALLYWLTHKTVNNEEELGKLVNLPCLGSLPAMRGFDRKNNGRCPILTEKHDKFGFSESVRLLRVRVEKAMNKEKGNVLMVTSTIPNEGKTTVSINLATALAHKGKRTLLVD